MAKKNGNTLPAVPLPRAVDGWVRKTKSERDINDQIEEIHLGLVGAKNEQYIRYCDAISDEQSVEGSTKIDDVKAAEMIRDAAEKMNSPVANEKLRAIIHAQNVAMRRYGQSRKERRDTAGLV